MTTDIVVSEYELVFPDEVELPVTPPVRLVAGESVVLRVHTEEITVTHETWTLVVPL